MDKQLEDKIKNVIKALQYYADMPSGWTADTNIAKQALAAWHGVP